MSPANERRCYIVTLSLIGWVHTQRIPDLMEVGTSKIVCWLAEVCHCVVLCNLYETTIIFSFEKMLLNLSLTRSNHAYSDLWVNLNNCRHHLFSEDQWFTGSHWIKDTPLPSDDPLSGADALSCRLMLASSSEDALLCNPALNVLVTISFCE